MELSEKLFARGDEAYLHWIRSEDRHSSPVFFVPGKPGTKGSTVSFYSETTGSLVTKNDCKRTKAWQTLVTLFARQKGIRLQEAGFPVELALHFQLLRPQRHFKGTSRDVLAKDAPPVHVQTPDLDKLIRAVCDGLTGIAYKDDSQVVAIQASKMWVEKVIHEGVFIRVKYM